MAIRYPIMADMRLEVSFDDGATFLACGDGVEAITPSMNEEKEERYFMNGGGGKTVFKKGMTRGFKITGIRAIGDAFQDALFAFEFKFGNNRTVKYRYYDSVTKKGETGQAEVIIADEGSGNAEDRQKIDLDLFVSGTPTEYTHTQA